MPHQVLRRAVQDEVGAVLERSQVHGRRHGRVDDDGSRMRDRRLQIRHREVRIRRSLEPDELDALGRRPGLVELDDAEAPRRERGERDAGAEVSAARQRDRVAGLQQGEDESGRRSGARRKEERGASVELAERGLGGCDSRTAEALVVELASLALLVVRPDRRPVERLHLADPIPAPAATLRVGPSCASSGKSRRQRPRQPIITAPPATTAATVPINDASHARLERAELVRGADEHPLDCADAALQLGRRHERELSWSGCSC